HAWVGLGDIVYVHSSEQLVAWLAEWGLEPGPVATLPIQQVAPEVAVRGPVPGLDEEMKALHRRVVTAVARYSPTPGATTPGDYSSAMRCGSAAPARPSAAVGPPTPRSPPHRPSPTVGRPAPTGCSRRAQRVPPRRARP